MARGFRNTTKAKPEGNGKAKDRANTPSPPVQRAALRIPDACIALGLSRTTIYDMAARGEIRLIKIVGRRLVPQSEIDRLISDALEAA